MVYQAQKTIYQSKKHNNPGEKTEVRRILVLESPFVFKQKNLTPTGKRNILDQLNSNDT